VGLPWKSLGGKHKSKNSDTNKNAQHPSITAYFTQVNQNTKLTFNSGLQSLNEDKRWRKENVSK